MEKFLAGQEVVCINSGVHRTLTKGKKYTVRQVRIDSNDIMVDIGVKGIDNQPVWYFGSRFEKVANENFLSF